MTKFFKRHEYNVTSNIKDYNDVAQKRARAVFSEDLMPQFDDFLNRAAQAKKAKKKVHFFIYYSGIVVQATDTEEFCGVDSNGDLIPLERYCEALSMYKNTFTVCYIEGVFIKDPKRDSTEFTLKHRDSLIMQLLPNPSFGTSTSTLKASADKKKEIGKHKKGMSILYLTLEYQEIASTIPFFLISRMTHKLISFVNSCGIAGAENPEDKSRFTNEDGSFRKPPLDTQELHVIFRENYQNMGVIDKEWKIWKIFNEPAIEKIRFEETQRQYLGEV